MSMGQAAGFAAIQSLHSDLSGADVNVRSLQNTLLENGAILELPSSAASTGRNDWKKNFN